MRILFIADKFDDESRDDVCGYPGGAELTDAAVIEASPFELEKLKFIDLKVSDIEASDLLIIGNLKTATIDQLTFIAEKTAYILFEHDMRICRYDGDFLRAKKEPIHFFLKRCICPHIYLQKLYRNSRGVIFLTRKQYEVYRKNPFFSVKKMEFLGSSAFNRSFLERVEKLKISRKKKSGTVIFNSPHPVKGYQQSKNYCIGHGIEPVEIYNRTPDEVLNMFEEAEQFVYLPPGIEWAGRMPVEARFLGCNVIINENVGVAGESWWHMDDESAFNFLKDTRDRFWRIVKHFINENTN